MSKGLASKIHGRPKTIIVRIAQSSGVDIAFFHTHQSRIKAVADMAVTHLFFKERRLIIQSHLLKYDLRQASICQDEHVVSVPCDYIDHLLPRQPPLPIIIIESAVFPQHVSASL